MRHYLTYFQIAVSIALVALVLVQQRGGGLSSALGGAGEFYGTRRGVEKFTFWATIVAAVLFVGSALVGLLAA